MVLASPSAPASAAEVLVGNKLSNKKKLRAAGSLFEELVKVSFALAALLVRASRRRAFARFGNGKKSPTRIDGAPLDFSDLLVGELPVRVLGRVVKNCAREHFLLAIGEAA
jgi:hypothetical protein